MLARLQLEPKTQRPKTSNTLSSPTLLNVKRSKQFLKPLDQIFLSLMLMPIPFMVAVMLINSNRSLAAYQHLSVPRTRPQTAWKRISRS